MTKPHSVIAALLLAGCMLFVGLPARTAVAQDGDKPPAPVKKEKTPLEKQIEAVAKEFAAGSVSKLLARVPGRSGEKPGKRLKLVLPAVDDGKFSKTLSKTQAKKVLEAWFEKRKDFALGKRKSLSPKVLEGRYVLTYRMKGKDESIRKDLVVRLRRKTKDGKTTGFELAAIELQ